MEPNATIKKSAEPTIPYEISDYLKKFFTEDFLTEIKRLDSGNGKTIYKVDVSADDTLYHFKFNAKGELIEKEMEPIIELDTDEYGVVD